jgi:hypothetical protein
MNAGRNARSKNIAVGETFGKLTVTGPYSMELASDGKRAVYPVCCDCGVETRAQAKLLLLGSVTSCGCKREWHGDSGERLYTIWFNIKRRCSELSNPRYKDYGGRGIRMDDAWESSYIKFREWALSHGYEENLTIERVDVNGDYSPQNCKWIPGAEQSANRRDTVRMRAFGEEKRVAEWVADPRCKVNYYALYARIKYGWTPEEALTTEILR